jgi:hypothetical protein
MVVIFLNITLKMLPILVTDVFHLNADLQACFPLNQPHRTKFSKSWNLLSLYENYLDSQHRAQGSQPPRKV